MVYVYIQSFLFVLFGAVLNESGVKFLSPCFWLLVAILIGIILSTDLIYQKANTQEDDEENEDPKNLKGNKK